VSSLMSRSEQRKYAASVLDAEGRSSDDPQRAALRPAKLRVEQVEVKWLPVSESAFLLWVLAMLLVVWLGIGFALGLI
jgi:hypothetical protein